MWNFSGLRLELNSWDLYGWKELVVLLSLWILYLLSWFSFSTVYFLSDLTISFLCVLWGWRTFKESELMEFCSGWMAECEEHRGCEDLCVWHEEQLKQRLEHASDEYWKLLVRIVWPIALFLEPRRKNHMGMDVDITADIKMCLPGWYYRAITVCDTWALFSGVWG